MAELSKGDQVTWRSHGGDDQLIGHADLLLDEVLDALDETRRRHELADVVRRELYGRNVLPGQWT